MENHGYLVGVVALIQRADGKVLMGLRPVEQVWAGFGGKLSAQETPEQGLRREVLEEIGVELESVEPCGFDSGVTPKGQNFVVLYYKASLADGAVPVLQETHAAAEMQWQDLSNLPSNMWERERQVLQRIQMS